VKKTTNAMMGYTSTPAKYWLLCLLFVIYLFDYLSTESIGGQVPMTVTYGGHTNCPALLNYSWFQDVLYMAEGSYPSVGKENLGRWVGLTEKQGDALTYLISTADTDRVTFQSNICSATKSNNINLRAQQSATGGELDNNPKPTLQSTEDLLGIDPSKLKLPKFSPDESLGITFLRDTVNGQMVGAKVVRRIKDRDAENQNNLKFLCVLDNNDYDEILTYQELSNFIEDQHTTKEEGTQCFFESISLYSFCQIVLLVFVLSNCHQTLLILAL
jgi:hypothetical protein